MSCNGRESSDTVICHSKAIRWVGPARGEKRILTCACVHDGKGLGGGGCVPGSGPNYDAWVDLPLKGLHTTQQHRRQWDVKRQLPWNACYPNNNDSSHPASLGGADARTSVMG